MFEVLVYLFENYFEANIRPDQTTLAQELSAAGFDQADIDVAFDWFSVLESMSEQSASAAGLGIGMRVFTMHESQKIITEGLSFIIFLEQAGVLTPAQRELVMDRAMALHQHEVGLEEIRWIVQMALWNQGKAKDYLFVEDAIFGEGQSTLH